PAAPAEPPDGAPPPPAALLPAPPPFPPAAVPAPLAPADADPPVPSVPDPLSVVEAEVHAATNTAKGSSDRFMRAPREEVGTQNLFPVRHRRLRGIDFEARVFNVGAASTKSALSPSRELLRKIALKNNYSEWSLRPGLHCAVSSLSETPQKR